MMLSQSECMRLEAEQNEKLYIGELKINAVKSLLTLFNGTNADEVLHLISKIIRKKIPKDVLERLPEICQKREEEKKSLSKPKDLLEETAQLFATFIGDAIDTAILNEIL